MTVLTRKFKTLRNRAYKKYSHILELYHATRAYWEGKKSRRGGYHISAVAPDGLTRTGAQANLRVRQYPLVSPDFSRTYIAMLPPTHLGASTLDYRLYDGNRLNVIPGRIAIYYAPSGGYGRYPARQSDGMEILTWHPSGQCTINHDALNWYNLAALRRAEVFANISVFNYRTERWIKTNCKPLGKSQPCGPFDRGAYRSYDHKTRDYIEPPEFIRWVRNFNSLLQWPTGDNQLALLIPRDRRNGFYSIRTDRRNYRSGMLGSTWAATDGTLAIKLTSYRQWVANRTRLAGIRRKVRSTINCVRREPQMIQELATQLNVVLAAYDMAQVTADLNYDPIEAAIEDELTVETWSESSQVGDRQARFLKLDEYDDND